jgi:hypothetical protein
MPAAQFEHTVEPAIEKAPAEQPTHAAELDADDDAEKVPATQSAQVVPDVYWPEGQDAVHDDEPIAEKRPTEQVTHALAPVNDEYVFAIQPEQLLADGPEYIPKAQLEQLDDPVNEE